MSGRPKGSRGSWSRGGSCIFIPSILAISMVSKSTPCRRRICNGIREINYKHYHKQNITCTYIKSTLAISELRIDRHVINIGATDPAEKDPDSVWRKPIFLPSSPFVSISQEKIGRKRSRMMNRTLRDSIPWISISSTNARRLPAIWQ